MSETTPERPPPHLRVAPLSAEELESDAAWWSLYEASFPIYERDSLSVILRSLEMGLGAALRASVDGKTIGLAVLHRLQNPAVVFLVYLAVAEEYRGRGMGSRLMDECWLMGAAGYRDGPAIGMVWEVDSPADAANAAEAASRMKRIEFYEHRGGVLLDTVYYQPPPRPWQPVKMGLMYRATASGPVDLGSLVRAIYFEKYGTVNGYPQEDLERILGLCGLPEEGQGQQHAAPSTHPVGRGYSEEAKPSE